MLHFSVKDILNCISALDIPPVTHAGNHEGGILVETMSQATVRHGARHVMAQTLKGAGSTFIPVTVQSGLMMNRLYVRHEKAAPLSLQGCRLRVA